MENQKNHSGDRLLWLAAGVVVLMGLGWLAVEAPWSMTEPESFDVLPITVTEAAGAAIETTVTPVAALSTASDPLHMARMALEAGMLIEPPAYSAWTLFGRVAASEPDNEAAREGLEQVAGTLLQRGHAAFEQGRYDDAAAIAGIITKRLPHHEGASALSAEVMIAITPPEPIALPEEPEPEAVVVELEPIDPIPEMNASFRQAMAQNAVLRPAGTSAVDIVRVMLWVAPHHELSVAARDMLVTELLDRSVQSTEALDTVAAQTWIDTAAALAGDAQKIARARDRLTRHVIESESQKIVPASDLVPVQIVAPEFPSFALERAIEGWVEIGFVVSPEGETTNITVIDASHDRFFREEAAAAVDTWRFEPVIFMNRAIPKRSYARLKFVLD